MYDICIIGAGPAGASAAMFTAKAGKSTVVIDNGKSITKRALLKNYYGIAEITGADIFDIGVQQCKDLGATVIEGDAASLTKTEAGFVIATETQTIEAKYVILATGAVTNLAEQAGAVILEHPEPRMKTRVEVDALGKTNIDGLWVAGTAAGVSVHAVITAGDGAKVAINLLSEMNGERYVDHDWV